jgi:hypothetical protein
MVRLDLRHRYNEVGSQCSARQPKTMEAAVCGFQRHLDQFIPVEIDEFHLAITKLVFKPRLVYDHLGVALVTGTFSHDDASCAQPKETTCGSANQQRVCVHWPSRHMVNEVGFQKNGSSSEIQFEEPECFD